MIEEIAVVLGLGQRNGETVASIDFCNMSGDSVVLY